MSKPPPPPPHRFLVKPVIKILLLILLCSFFYHLSSYTITTNSNPQTNSNDQHSKSNFLCPTPTLINLSRTFSTSLDYQPHHTIALSDDQHSSSTQLQFFPYCHNNFTDYCPCQDPLREKQFDIENKFYRERHCPHKYEFLQCLIPKPVDYRTRFRWPTSRKFAWFNNVPSQKLLTYKKSQNWVQLEGDRFVFPGGGTTFRNGVKDYLDLIKKMVPLKSGNVRTVLDVGCGVASFGAALTDYNVLTMSIAPRDIHEAQIQFALERGLPAMLGILSIHRLPYPSRSFDMAHCSRCLVPWTDHGGLYLMEIDRVLRPGGYWVLSGPPINWKTSHKEWEREAENLQKEQATLEDLAMRLCWKKIAEHGPVAVWKKPTNHVQCHQKSKLWKFPRFCNASDPDAGWYKKMEPCITPLPNVKSIKDISGGALEKWPKRLNMAPPRIKSSEIKDGKNVIDFDQDNRLWKRRVSQYGILKSLTEGKYRNILDMNAGFGGFAAALSKYQVWVMNVVPFDASNTLGAIYERGLIGTYMNWCEAFSTYPRTYDLIHANRIFGMCDIIDILFEMHRILRPEGTIIVRDHIDIIVKLKDSIAKMRWKSKIQHSELGASHPEKILIIGNSIEIS
ncbi:hypothetical protein AQUCO_00100567v1 [Aquilegia coerulea]|uniref:Methyltransferase n=1 Tax=Aquilegia coerulea TaxID=218851 RepID=A0A2G5FAX6_AQUCA|nr:hypothetical protein AQUCO_00100567v1 [Aquilegia coerulea]